MSEKNYDTITWIHQSSLGKTDLIRTVKEENNENEETGEVGEKHFQEWIFKVYSGASDPSEVLNTIGCQIICMFQIIVD